MENTRVYFIFGRMNPPTIGHNKLIEALSDYGFGDGPNPQGPGDAYLFLSQSVSKPKDYKAAAAAGDDIIAHAKAIKNPLNWEQKCEAIAAIYGDRLDNVILSDNPSVKTVGQALTFLYEQGYREAYLVAGSDRVDGPESFAPMFPKYQADPKTPTFDHLEVISGGERDADGDGGSNTDLADTSIEGMSGTKIRAWAIEGNRDAFANALATTDDSAIDYVFNMVQEGMAIPEKYLPKEPEAEDFVDSAKMDEKYNPYPKEAKFLIEGIRSLQGHYELSNDDIQAIQYYLNESDDKMRIATNIATHLHLEPSTILSLIP